MATTHIFWAADFVNYSDVTSSVYNEIPNISNYHHFKATNASISFDFPYNWYVMNTLAFLTLFIYSNIFKSFCNPFNTQINMDIATSCGSSWLSVGDLWSYSFDAARNLMNNLESGDYPLTITIKQYEQLLRVYETCISPSQFIPLLINDTNR